MPNGPWFLLTRPLWQVGWSCREGRLPAAVPRPPRRAARSAFERFLQLAGDLVDRGVHLVLGDLGGTGKRLVECLLDGGLAADHEEPCLVSREFLSRLTELLAGKSPAPEPLRDDTDARPVQPLDHMGLAVLLIDHGRVQRADRPLLVQLLDG